MGKLVSRPNGQICPTFLALWLLTSTSKKDPRSWNLINITSWDGCNLFSNSSSPIKGSKIHVDHWFLDQMAKSIQLFSFFNSQHLLPKRFLGVEIPQIPPHRVVAIYFPIPLVVGISATMCHSAEKIPSKEGCQSKRVSKKQQSYPSRGLK